MFSQKKIANPFIAIGQLSYLFFIAFYWLTELPGLNIKIGSFRIPYMSVFICIGIFSALMNISQIAKKLFLIKLYLTAAFFFLFAITMSMIAHNSGIKSIIEFYIYLIIPVVALIITIDPSKFIWRILKAFMLNGFIMACIGLYRLYTGHSRWVELVDHEKVGLGTRNLDAYLMLLGMVSCLLLLTKVKNRLFLIFLLTSSAICFLGVFLSLSRGMLLTSLFTLLILCLLSSKKARIYIVLICFIPILIIIIGISTPVGKHVYHLSIERFSLLAKPKIAITKEGIRSSVPGRLKLISLSMIAISENPILGIGYGNFSKFSKKYNISVHDAHNNLLLIWTEYGTLAIIPFLYIYFLPLFLLLKIKELKIDKRMYAILFTFSFIILFTSLFTNYVTYFGYWMTLSAVFPYFLMIKKSTNDNSLQRKK